MLTLVQCSLDLCNPDRIPEVGSEKKVRFLPPAPQHLSGGCPPRPCPTTQPVAAPWLWFCIQTLSSFFHVLSAVLFGFLTTAFMRNQHTAALSLCLVPSCWPCVSTVDSGYFKRSVFMSINSDKYSLDLEEMWSSVLCGSEAGISLSVSLPGVGGSGLPSASGTS